MEPDICLFSNVGTIIIIWKKDKLDIEKISLNLLQKSEKSVRTCTSNYKTQTFHVPQYFS